MSKTPEQLKQLVKHIVDSKDKDYNSKYLSPTRNLNNYEKWLIKYLADSNLIWEEKYNIIQQLQIRNMSKILIYTYEIPKKNNIYKELSLVNDIYHIIIHNFTTMQKEYYSYEYENIERAYSQFIQSMRIMYVKGFEFLGDIDKHIVIHQNDPCIQELVDLKERFIYLYKLFKTKFWEFMELQILGPLENGMKRINPLPLDETLVFLIYEYI
jgi:hypothetical protein